MANNSSFEWLNSQLLSSDMNDMTIRVEVEDGLAVSFPANTFVLSSQSDVFKAMLTSVNFLEGMTKILTLKETSPRTVEYLLRFLYTGAISKRIPVSYVMELLALSHQYQIQKLVDDCNQRLQNSINFSNVCQLYEISVLYSLGSLTSLCKPFIQSNLKAILENDLHFYFKAEATKLYTNSTPTEASDMNSLKQQALTRWIKWSSCNGTTQVSFQDVKINDNVYSSFSKSPDWVNELCLSPKHHDVELIVQGKLKAIFPAHSIVLMLQSKVFCQMLEGKNKGGKIVELKIPSINARVAEMLIRFLYTQVLASLIPDSILVPLLRTAIKYKVEPLVKECNLRICKVVSSVNCCNLLEVAKELGLKPLEKKCKETMGSHAGEILQNNLHFDLTTKSMLEFTQMPNFLTHNNLSMCESINSWARWICCVEGKDPNAENVGVLTKQVLSLVPKVKAKQQGQRPSNYLHPNLRTGIGNYHGQCQTSGYQYLHRDLNIEDWDYEAYQYH